MVELAPAKVTDGAVHVPPPAKAMTSLIRSRWRGAGIIGRMAITGGSASLGPEDLVLCSGTLARQTGFRQRLKAASDAGFAAISLWGRDYRRARADGHSDADIGAMLADHGLVVGEIDPAWWWTPGAAEVAIDPSVDPFDVFAHGESELLSLAETVGARSLNAVDVLGGSWTTEQGAEAFARLCDRANEQGLVVHLEWLAWSKVADVGRAAEIVELADRSNGGLNVDVWHCARTGTTPEQLRLLPGRRVTAIQMSDGPAAAEPDLLHATLHDRLLPGHGELPLGGYLGALKEAGVRAPVGVEVFSDVLHGLEPAQAARLAFDATTAVLGEVGWGVA